MRLRKALPALGEMSNGDIFDAAITLADAQRTIAREYGFGSWRALRVFVQSHPATDGFLATPGAVPPDVAAVVGAVDAGDAAKLKALTLTRRWSTPGWPATSPAATRCCIARIPGRPTVRG